MFNIVNRNRQVMKIEKFSDLNKVNYDIVNSDFELVGFYGKHEFIGCGSETAEDGTIKPYYLVAEVLYDKTEDEIAEAKQHDNI